jgi:hypothetical protein
MLAVFCIANFGHDLQIFFALLPILNIAVFKNVIGVDKDTYRTFCEFCF